MIARARLAAIYSHGLLVQRHDLLGRLDHARDPIPYLSPSL